jgi:acetylornithine deacetylase/succinyl-diaminopimelate desuccinylase-like protein
MVEFQDTLLVSLKKMIDDNRKIWLEDFLTFLRFPSISADPHYKPSLNACANWLVDYLKELDFQVELWQTPNHPILFASYNKAGPDKPTLLIYNHYDVQPVDPLEAWLNPPFEPTIRGNEIYARGAQDNKGQCFYVIQALKLLRKLRGTLPINIKLCIEGEEEIGSQSLSAILKEKKDLLKADYAAIVDLSIRDPKIPAITLGTRGIITLDVNIKSANTDLHSGSHGGIIQNPIHVLVQLLAGLRNVNGSIAIPGFYDHVIEMKPEERSIVSLQFDMAEYQKTTGGYALGGEKDYSVLERAWIRPTLEINGISGGYAGEGFKTVIPAQAHAKISCRLVPNQDPLKIGRLIADHLKEHAPQGVEIEVDVHPGKGKAVRISPTEHVVKVFGKAFEEVFGVPCEYIYEGASIPIIPELREACGGEAILLGLGLVTDQIHAPNEHFGIDRLEKGMLIMAKAIDLLAN